MSNDAKSFFERYMSGILVLIGWLAWIAAGWAGNQHDLRSHEVRISSLEQRLDVQQATVNKISIDMEVVKSKLEFIVQNIKEGRSK